MRTRFAVVALACSTLTACGLKGALTDHINVVARVGSTSLSANDLAALFRDAKIPVAPNLEHAEILANIWVSYHRVAYASAHGDSLMDMIDVAMTPLFNSERVAMYQDSIRKAVQVDSASEAGYAAGANGVYAARHILLRFPDSASTPCQPLPCPSAKQRDSVRQAARTLAAQVTNANFADMARAHPGDPTSAAQGGNLGIFRKADMIPAFSNATAALKPGEISGAVESVYGEHIIQRRTFADVRDDYISMFNTDARRTADSAWRAQLSRETNLTLVPNVAAVAKLAVADLGEHRGDRSTMATFKGGEMTVAGFLNWLQTRDEQIYQQIKDAPDSSLDRYIKDVAVQEISLTRANAAKIEIPAQEKQALHDQFRQAYGQIQQALGVSPQDLAGARTMAEREKLAAERADTVIVRFMAGEGQPVGVPAPIKAVLDAKYPVRLSPVALNHVVELATPHQ